MAIIDACCLPVRFRLSSELNGYNKWKKSHLSILPCRSRLGHREPYFLMHLIILKSGRKSRKLFSKLLGCRLRDTCWTIIVVAWSIGGPLFYAAGRAVVSRAAFFLGMDTVTLPFSSVP
eukprot:scaffold79867_cov54-Attheya_sp.AAC.2